MKQVLVMGAMLLLSSCVSTSLVVGNFANTTDIFNARMAQDTVEQIKSLYPPARTQFALTQRDKDTFGINLKNGLRQSGYGLSEIVGRGAVPLSYVVDEVANKSLYRVTVFIDSQSLTRAYGVDQGQLTPLSHWTRKE